MADSNSRTIILDKIKKSLQTPTGKPFENIAINNQIYQPQTEDLDILFAEQFTKMQGHFNYCVSEQDAAESIIQLCNSKNWQAVFIANPQIKNILSGMPPHAFTANLAASNVSITFCESLVARTGSMILSSKSSDGRTASVYSPAHICIAYTNQLVYDIKDGIQALQNKYSNNDIPSMITLATGPSRTADIEKTLVTGVHGPKEVYCFLIERN